MLLFSRAASGQTEPRAGTVEQGTPEAPGLYEAITPEQQIEIEFHNREGNRHRGAGNLREAARHFEQSLRIAPDQPHVMGTLGAVDVGLRRYQAAIPLLERALPAWTTAKEMSGDVIRNLLVSAYVAVRREPEAIRMLRKAGRDENDIARRLELARKLVRR